MYLLRNEVGNCYKETNNEVQLKQWLEAGFILVKQPKKEQPDGKNPKK